MEHPENFDLKPIGRVHSSVKELADDCWGGAVSAVELYENLFGPESTLRLDQYSEVVFLLDKIPTCQVEKAARHPGGRADWPKMRVFVQRSKDRPDRIGITACKIESVNGRKIRVSELDAVDGTPVLDVKPYFKGFAPRGEVREPSWAGE